MKRILYTALFAAVATASTAAMAQAWPTKPLKLVVAYPAGGGLDFVGRTVAQRLSERLGQPVLVENKTGASGAIGTDYVAKAAPDGYTLLMASPAEVVVGPAAGQKTGYDAQKDLTPVSLVGETPLVLAAHPSVPATDLASFVAYAKSHPQALTYGTPGSGSSMQFAGESFKAGTGTSIQHVPYRGAAPALTDALGGQISMAIVGMPPVVPYAKSGKLRVLAVTTAKRSSVMPDVPAVSELPGMKDYRFSNWMTVFAPAGTPHAIVERISADIAEIVREPATRKHLLEAGVEPMGVRGEALASFLTEERQRYDTVAKERNIRFGD
ncbi:MAG: tripartite tricarboxylate transporter substrate binding protein [Gammaproteobacteria bacterium]|nr:tripartite tricarboxylate transporter substrate binding protein [Gammaproteobacteria bacterium]MBU2285175.1 tripartite tricarboxylate transporter substrate binding protein [Gammaproteobacteria bacterium]MBU2407350.1 tripartite tricarboxylate transporter substrate binding protein [Gammaproteobacteria bacterium]